MVLRFSDGVSFDTSGPYRVTYRFDGYYVVGQGMMCSVDSRNEGDRLIETLQKNNEKQSPLLDDHK